MRSISVPGLTLCLALVGCVGGDEAGDTGLEGPWASLGERPCPEDSFLTWENFGDPFVRDWCTGCHATGRTTLDDRKQAPLEVNLDSVESVHGHMERIWMRAADHNRTMPPAGGPAADERALLGEWLACGAPTREELHTP